MAGLGLRQNRKFTRRLECPGAQTRLLLTSPLPFIVTLGLTPPSYDSHGQNISTSLCALPVSHLLMRLPRLSGWRQVTNTRFEEASSCSWTCSLTGYEWREASDSTMMRMNSCWATELKMVLPSARLCGIRPCMLPPSAIRLQHLLIHIRYT